MDRGAADEEPSDARAFALVRWGLRFADPVTEAAYVAAWTQKMMRPARIVGVFLLLFNLQALVTNPLWIRPAELAGRLAWMHVGLSAVLVVALASGSTRWGRKHFLDGCLLCALTDPIAIITFYSVMPVESFHAQALVGAGQIFALVATLVIGHLGFVRSLIASAGFAVGFHYVLVHVPRSSVEANRLGMLFHVINATCLLACFLGERRDRRLFLNERLLREARARSERRLRQDAQQLTGEVRGQVAARSRELSEALARAGR
ncbi:MAG TPA: hypothetical protein VFQ65_09355 [Kofleriaceae bacterium]|nr:hypothetical protein [Kofleriaceae bacterium]